MEISKRFSEFTCGDALFFFFKMAIAMEVNFSVFGSSLYCHFRVHADSFWIRLDTPGVHDFTV